MLSIFCGMIQKVEACMRVVLGGLHSLFDGTSNIIGLVGIPLVADSMHTRSDIFACVGVILGLVVVKMGYPLADPVIALLISGLILLTGLEIVKDSSKVLLDKALVEESMIKSKVPGVRDVLVHLE